MTERIKVDQAMKKAGLVPADLARELKIPVQKLRNWLWLIGDPLSKAQKSKLYARLGLQVEVKGTCNWPTLIKGAKGCAKSQLQGALPSAPSPIPKDQPYRSKKTLGLAQDQACVRCGKKDGTVVSAHYAGLGQNRAGKAMGQKAGDLFSAFLCSTCHAEKDQYLTTKGLLTDQERLQLENEWLWDILKTIERKAKGGHVEL
ncbi:MAG: hypothetical protein A2600_13765 [Candidatus Lambdaproteobacteria bacterium RIFOXYD1_FULL_56_27]|uniref:Uncharacterized protein n=1 Tax=Candidatus Lambdaproteobacteria bacterium RIFOXYD2_FULL_56_26 TaxID=1817773 RepID=A0A1F6GLJ3_9PROT|nr:MAG: hypothetical protein A2557_00595 [Candidatus Lambdaproteobacteria bacterium RIFOXYD2_FULL_56_26]OGH01557.1 MAG: hypothetical protein A2426_11325 [Candidatus Lambdaproteobacteria bacterium RIFOXYC1_FULL_56_13]OGH08821.1 MAG: hypothetical protein A2600_13765 [Candidatus Lambdaproteobacteria bacterium RIFOXYD1_FULL_56_27]